MVWYSHLSTVSLELSTVCHDLHFSKVDETEVDVFQEFPCFLYDPVNTGNSQPFLNSAWTSGSSWFTTKMKSSMQDSKHDLN